MRWTALALILAAQQAFAQWVQFDVCGFKMPSEDSLVPEETQLAPGRGPVHVWLPSITMVIGYGRTRGPECTKLMVHGKQIFVIGDLDQTLKALNKARGQ